LIQIIIQLDVNKSILSLKLNELLKVINFNKLKH